MTNSDVGGAVWKRHIGGAIRFAEFPEGLLAAVYGPRGHSGRKHTVAGSGVQREVGWRVRHSAAGEVGAGTGAPPLAKDSPRAA